MSISSRMGHGRRHRDRYRSRNEDVSECKKAQIHNPSIEMPSAGRPLTIAALEVTRNAYIKTLQRRSVKPQPKTQDRPTHHIYENRHPKPYKHNFRDKCRLHPHCYTPCRDRVLLARFASKRARVLSLRVPIAKRIVAKIGTNAKLFASKDCAQRTMRFFISTNATNPMNTVNRIQKSTR